MFGMNSGDTCFAILLTASIAPGQNTASIDGRNSNELSGKT